MVHVKIFTRKKLANVIFEIKKNPTNVDKKNLNEDYSFTHSLRIAR